MIPELIDRAVNWTASALLELWTISRRDLPLIKPHSLAYSCGAYLVLGIIISEASLFVFPEILIINPIIRSGAFLGLPIIVGYFAKGFANYRTYQKRETIPRNEFWKFFFLALGIGLLRMSK